jgi:hypothetical protein
MSVPKAPIVNIDLVGLRMNAASPLRAARWRLLRMDVTGAGCRFRFADIFMEFFLSSACRPE